MFPAQACENEPAAGAFPLPYVAAREGAQIGEKNDTQSD